MKMTLSLLAAVGLLLTANAANDAGKEDLGKLKGSWATASLVFNGQDITEKYKFKFVFKDDQIALEGNDAIKKEYPTFKIKLDPTTKPPCIDMTVSGGVQKDLMIEGIYELKGDQLKICVKLVGKDRPSEFTSEDGSSAVLLVLTREK